MSEVIFPICGVEIPEMIGRQKLFTELMADLTKPTPSHKSIVGSRFSGKTVILQALQNKLSEEDSPYTGVIYWDLGHQTPRTNDEFLGTMADKLSEVVSDKENGYADYLKEDDGLYQNFREVLDDMAGNDSKVLMLWDGFDKPLNSGQLTRNLWDQLLELARSPALRLVTASRKPLHQLLRDENSATSDFWGVFDQTPVKVGPFETDDLEPARACLAGCTFAQSALSELNNWSGGYPVFYLSLLNGIKAEGMTGEISNIEINTVAEKLQPDLSGYLGFLWGDCSTYVQELYQNICENDLSQGEFSPEHRFQLEEKGFAIYAGGKLKAGCRFLQKHLEQSGVQTGSLLRLFAEENVYRTNIRNLLEYRFHQFPTVDPQLSKNISRLIEDIPDYLDDCIKNIRGIIDRSLKLIWSKEFGDDLLIPQEWVDEWGYDCGNNDRQLDWLDGNKVPNHRALECRLLQYLTGSHQCIKRGAKAKYVTSQTYVLINALKAYGDFANHLEGATVTLGTAVSATMLVIELAGLLEAELGQ